MTIVKLANGELFDTDSSKVVIKAKKSKINGVVLWEGKSILTGDNIAAIATFKTSNDKTGDMVQTWIIRTDISPQDASKQKLDNAVCGDCPHRHSLGGGCYVTLFQAPRAIYTSYKKGNYPDLDMNKHSQYFSNRALRIGSYGDPAAIPFNVWDKLINISSSFTGYTHQMSHKNFDKRIATICMISVETSSQAKRAQKQGFKTFRVKTDNMSKLDNEVKCLSESHNISCIDCGLCNGKSVNVVVNVHGHMSNRFTEKFERIDTVSID